MIPYCAPWQWARLGRDVQIFEHCVILRPERVALGDGVRSLV